MAIFRTKKNREFTTLPNSTLQNVSLSWEARGLLAYLISLPEDWEIHMSELVNRAPSGKDKLARIVKELTQNGYIVKEHLRGERGRFEDWIYDVHDEPQSLTVKGQTPDSVNPTSVNPTSVNPTTVNPQLQITHNTNHPTKKAFSPKKPAAAPLHPAAEGGGGSFLEIFGFSWGLDRVLEEKEALRVAKLHKLDASQTHRARGEFAAEALRGFRKSPNDAWFWLCKKMVNDGLAHTNLGDQNLPSWGG